MRKIITRRPTLLLARLTIFGPGRTILSQFASAASAIILSPRTANDVYADACDQSEIDLDRESKRMDCDGFNDV